VRLAAALGRFWVVPGRLSEGRRWLESLLEPDRGLPPALRVHALNWLNVLLLKQGDTAGARAVLAESCTICAAVPAGAAPASLPLGGVTPPLLFRMLLAGDLRQAAAALEAAPRSSGDRAARKAPAGHCVPWASTSTCWATIPGRRRSTRRAWPPSRSSGTRIAWATSSPTSPTPRGLGDYTRATGLHRASLALRRDLGDTAGIAERFEGLAGIAAMSGQPAAAARLYGAADGLLTAIGGVREWLDEAPHGRTVR